MLAAGLFIITVIAVASIVVRLVVPESVTLISDVDDTFVLVMNGPVENLGAEVVWTGDLHVCRLFWKTGCSQLRMSCSVMFVPLPSTVTSIK